MPAVGRWRMAAAITLVAGLTSWASALADGSPPPAPSASGLPRLSVKAATHPRRVLAARPSHLIVVVEENHAFEQIIGSPAAPFLNHLAAHGTLLTHYYAITHPSLPNYVALLSGRDPIHSDCRTCTFPGPTLVDQLEAHHISWAAYLQGLPRPCSTVARAGAYTTLVDPFMHAADIRHHPDVCGGLRSRARDALAGGQGPLARLSGHPNAPPTARPGRAHR